MAKDPTDIDPLNFFRSTSEIEVDLDEDKDKAVITAIMAIDEPINPSPLVAEGSANIPFSIHIF